MNTINQVTDLLNHGDEYKRKLAELMRSGDELSRLYVVRRNIPGFIRDAERFEALLQSAANELAKGDKRHG